MHQIIVDPADAHLVYLHKWHITKYTSGGNSYLYWMTRIKGKQVSLQSLISGKHARFVNGDTLDCRRSNLTSNRYPIKRKSEYRGVHGEDNHWIATIRTGGRTFEIGKYTTEEEAARAYDTKAVKLLGPWATTNYGNRTTSSTDDPAIEANAGSTPNVCPELLGNCSPS